MENVNPYESPEADLEQEQPQTYKPKVFAINGRLGRARYLCYSFAFTFFLIIVIGAVGGLSGLISETGEMSTVHSLLVSMPILLLIVIMARRRLHDLNFSGWWSILMLIPLVSIIPSLFLMFAPGNKHDNDYGLKPAKNGALVYIFMSLFIVVFAGLIAVVALPFYQEYMSQA